MSEKEIVYEDEAIVIHRGRDERNWLFVEQTYYPYPQSDESYVSYRISLSPSEKTCDLLKYWEGWDGGEGGLNGSVGTTIRLDEEEGAELRRRLRELKKPDEFDELWAALWRD